MLVELSMRDSNVEKLWKGELSLPSLEKLDLSSSVCLIECPNLSGAPNIKVLKLDNCRRLSLVDPSVWSLPKLEILHMNGCNSLEILSSDICSSSIKELHALYCRNLQEISVSFTNIWLLALEPCDLNKIPSSVFHIRNLEVFYFTIDDILMDLPENFTKSIYLSDPFEHECDTMITLHNVLPSPAFLTLRFLMFYNCKTLSEIPDNICLLSSLECLTLFDCAIIRFPQTIKDLPLLIHFEVGRCNMLQSIPVLPPSIQCFHVWDCKSLHIVSTSMSKPSEISKYKFILFNCIELDPHSHDTILEDAIVRIEFGARLHSSISKNKEDASSDHDGDDGIWYLLPTMSNKTQELFHYHSSQALLSIELPSNMSGFIYYMVLSQGRIDRGGSLGCECYFETSLGKRINKTCFGINQMVLWFDADADGSLNMMSDHVVLWYDAQYCKQIMDAVGYNPNLTFRFFVKTIHDGVEVKQCGFRWIYNSADQTSVEEEGLCETKRSWDIHELESNIVQNRAEGFEFVEQEETIALEVDEETKDLRCSLEELLHIGIGGDLMK